MMQIQKTNCCKFNKRMRVYLRNNGSNTTKSWCKNIINVFGTNITIRYAGVPNKYISVQQQICNGGGWYLRFVWRAHYKWSCVQDHEINNSREMKRSVVQQNYVLPTLLVICSFLWLLQPLKRTDGKQSWQPFPKR